MKADVTLPNDATRGYISFGANGKHITVKSDEGEMKKLSFPSYGVLTGDCTFDNVNVTGSRLFCNGYRTNFTENGQIYLSETLYGGGYKTTVDSTYVVIAASGYINPSSSSGLHDVIGGSYQGNVVGDTYRVRASGMAVACRASSNFTVCGSSTQPFEYPQASCIPFVLTVTIFD